MAEMCVEDPFMGRSDSFDTLPWFSDEHLNGWICEILRPYGSSICDVGAGTGLMLSEYARAFDWGLLVEPSFSMRRMLEERASNYESFTVSTGSAEELPIPDDHVDVAISKNALHHAVDVSDAVAEMARIAKRAVCVVEVTLPDESCRPYLELLLSSKEPGRALSTIWSPSDLQRLIEPHCDRVHLLNHDQYIDLDLWLASSPLSSRDVAMLQEYVRSQPAAVRSAMQMHYRSGRWVQLRRITAAVGFLDSEASMEFLRV